MVDTKDDQMTQQDLLRAVTDAMRITHSDVARKAGIHRTVLAKWRMADEAMAPRPETLERLAMELRRRAQKLDWAIETLEGEVARIKKPQIVEHDPLQVDLIVFTEEKEET
jgi:transcriptional regulator with XRE-family HTH domain